MKEELKCPCCGGPTEEVLDNAFHLIRWYKCTSCPFRCGAGYFGQITEAMVLLRKKRKEDTFYIPTTFA